VGAAIASSVAYVAIFVLALVFYRSVVNRQSRLLRQTPA
jgi:hypothetical protein